MSCCRRLLDAEKDVAERNDEEVGGLFKIVSKADLSSIDDVDRTRLLVSTARDWTQEEVTLESCQCLYTFPPQIRISLTAMICR